MVLGNRQVTAATPKSIPSSQTKVRNASNADYQENWKELPSLRCLEENSGALRGASPQSIIEKGVKRDGVPLFFFLPLSLTRRGGLRG
mgnify:CR=1 FL=1